MLKALWFDFDFDSHTTTGIGLRHDARVATVVIAHSMLMLLIRDGSLDSLGSSSCPAHRPFGDFGVVHAAFRGGVFVDTIPLLMASSIRQFSPTTLTDSQSHFKLMQELAISLDEAHRQIATLKHAASQPRLTDSDLRRVARVAQNAAVSAASVTSPSNGGSTLAVVKAIGNVTLSRVQQYVAVDTSAVRTVTLPADPVVHESHTVKDSTGAGAAVNNITVSGNGKLIDGAATNVIAVTRGAVTYVYNGTGWDVV